MKAFLKDNMVLAVGIALPLLLTLIFFAATQIGTVAVDPPRHSVIFATSYYHNNNHYPYRITVKQNKVHFAYFPPKDEKDHRNWQKPRLFIYNPVTENSREIELPAIDNPNVKINTPVPELASKTVNSLTESPDGYVFEYEYRSGGNLMTELFGGGYRSRSNHVLRKGSYRVTVPKSMRYNSQFVGWVIEDKDA